MKSAQLSTCFIVVAILTSWHIAYAQPSPLRINQKSIDSLIRILPSLPQDTNRVMNLHLLARMMTMNDEIQAAKYAQEGYTLAQKLDFKKGEILCMQTQVWFSMITSDWVKGTELCYKGINLSEKYQPAEALFFYCMMGLMLEQQNEINKSLEWILKSKNHPLFAKASVEKAQWITLLRLSSLYEKLNQLDSAFYYAQKSYHLGMNHSMGGHPAWSLTIMGTVEGKRKHFTEAIDYLQQAILLFKQNEYQSPIHATQYEIAEVYDKMNLSDSAIHYATLAFEGAETFDNHPIINKASALLAEKFENININKAYEYLKISNETEEILMNAAKIKQLEQVEYKEQQRLSDLQSAEIAYNNKIRQNTLLGISGTFVLLALLLWRNNRAKQKSNTLLQAQKEEIRQTLKELKSTQTQLIQAEKIATRAQQAEALRLKELDAVKTKLYTNITHEFRTPLTVIMGVANQVLENPNEHLKKGLNMIMRNGQNLLTLVNQMLDLSKLESGKLSLQYLHADVISFLGYIIDSFHSLAESKGVQIHFISASEQLYLDFDEVRLQQIVSNIISNAIKFTPKGGHIYVSTDTKNDSFILKIKDTGIGIDEADLPYIFDRFFQADDSHTRHGEGTGIGLALTYELVKLMQGTIAVKSKKDHGSEFEVVLPLRNILDSAEIPEKFFSESMEPNPDYSIPIDEGSKSSLIRPFHNANGSAHVLIADDNEDVLAFLASCLENEFAVEIAKNGQECEEMAFNSTPDLIVMDVMMPFKDGFEVCKTLKTDERTSHIPIILLTAKADLESRLQGLEQGADDYLTKPFHKKELLLRIKNLLDLRRQLQQYYRLSLEGNLSANSVQDSDGSNINSEFNGSKGSHPGNQHPSIPLASSLENAFVIKVRKTIETHLEEPNFDVEKLCHFLALSRSQVHRKLSALTGLSATHFIRYVRLIKAKEMIIKSGFSIAAIAYDCGFNDPGYFGRIFKQEFGISPQVWREQNSA